MTPRPPSLRHPGRWLWLLLLVPVVLGVTRLRFAVEVLDLLPNDLPVVEGLKLYQAHFANARELLVTVRAPDADQAENAARRIAERLRTQTNLVASVLWEPPWQEHPEQLGELLAYLWFNQPPATLKELSRRLAPENLASTLAATRQELATALSPDEIARLSYDPYGLTRLPDDVTGSAPSFGSGQELFSSTDGTFRLLFVYSAGELRNYRDCQSWLAEVKPIVTAALGQQASAGTAVGYTGGPAFQAEIAAGMQHDITTSVGGTAAIIALLFWLAHRRLKPMLWLLTLLAVVLGTTLALGGLIFGTLNVVSLGFAAILLGLAVDYAVVHYQEALAQPQLSIPQIRHAIAPSIFWAAVTTISAFLVLNFGGLPGLGQLGTLVGLGVALAACIMIFEYLPPLFPERNQESAEAVEPELPVTQRAPRIRRGGLVLGLTGALLLTALVVLASGLPRMDPTSAPLRPRRSQAYTTLAEVQAHLSGPGEPLWLVVRGPTVAAVAERLATAQTALTGAVSNQLASGFTLPTLLWPRPEFQAANRATAAHLASERQTLSETAQAQGFKPRSLGLADAMLTTWSNAAASTGVFWPSNSVCQWVFDKFAARTATNYFALGLINPNTNAAAADPALIAALESKLPHDGVWLTGWELLGNGIFGRVRASLWKLVIPMTGLVLVSLLLAFRRATEMCLSLGTLLLSGLCLLAVMRLAGWSWNLLNLMAMPLVLGTGVDYSIFMQLALRRFDGDSALAYRSVGRALLLCGGTAIAGFGSLAWSSNAGMASLGQVCAVGIAGNMLLAIFLLPTWWQCLNASARKPAPDQAARPNAK